MVLLNQRWDGRINSERERCNAGLLAVHLPLDTLQTVEAISQSANRALSVCESCEASSFKLQNGSGILGVCILQSGPMRTCWLQAIQPRSLQMPGRERSAAHHQLQHATAWTERLKCRNESYLLLTCL